MIFSTLLYSIDLFKSPISLLFNKRHFITTNLGQFLSIVIIIIEIIIASKSDLFNRKNPIIQTTNIKTDRRFPVVFDNNIVAIGVQDRQTMHSFFDPQVFSVRISNEIIQKNSDNDGLNRTSIEKNTHLCNDNESDAFIQLENYKNFGFTNNLCLDENDNKFNLEGFWDEPFLNFISIELKICSNNSKQICKSQEEIEKILTGKTFNIYYKDTAININDFETPFKTQITNDYQIIDFKLGKTMSYNFQNLELSNDNGLVFQEIEVEKEVGFVSKNPDLHTRGISDTVLVSISIFSDKEILKIQRTYSKIQDLLARLGGIMQSLLFLGQIITNFEYSLLLKNTILNSLYSFKKPKQKTNISSEKIPSEISKKNLAKKNEKFDGEEKNQNKKKNNIKLNFDKKLESKFNQNLFSRFPENVITLGKHKELSPLNLKLDLNESSANTMLSFSKLSQGLIFHKKNFEGLVEPQSPSKTPNSYFQKRSKSFFMGKLKILKLHKFKLSGKHLYLNLGKYFKLAVKKIIPFLKRNHDEELFIQCEKIYEKEMDFVEVLKKLQEIEKLKKILLDSKQQVLFNFLKKPLVHLEFQNSEKIMKARESFSIQVKSGGLNEIHEMQEFQNAIDEFENLATNGLLSDVDKRIMMMIDKESAKFLNFADESSPKAKRQNAKF